MAEKRDPNPFIVAFGILLLIIGMFGLFLPILQGILTILAGIAVLSSQLPSVRKRLMKIFPRFISDRILSS